MASSKSKQDKPKAPVVAGEAGQAAPKMEKAVAKAAKGDKGSSTKKKDAKKGGKPGLIARAKAYFKGVRSEVKRVIWPTKQEMVKYTGAVLGMLVFFGVLIAVVDAVIVPALYAFSGLR